MAARFPRIFGSFDDIRSRFSKSKRQLRANRKQFVEKMQPETKPTIAEIVTQSEGTFDQNTQYMVTRHWQKVVDVSVDALNLESNFTTV